MAQAALDYVNMLADVQANDLLLQELYSKTLEKMIVLERSNFVFTTLAKKVSIPRKAGTKTWTTKRYLHLPVDLTSGKLAEGVTPTPMRVEGVKVSATIDQFGAYIEETDVAEALHFDNIMTIYQPELARHAAETIERNLLEQLEGECSVRYTGSATSDDEVVDELTFSDVRKGWLTMRNYHRDGHSQFGGAPVLVAHINVIQDLIDDTVLKDYVIVPGYDETPIKNGSLAQFKMYGIYFVETKVLDPVLNADSPAQNVYTSYLLGKDSYALLDLGGTGVQWEQKGFTPDSNDPLAQRATMGYKLWTGAKVLDPMAICAIKSISAYDSHLADFSTDPLGRTASQLSLSGAGSFSMTISATLAQTAQNEEDTLTVTLVDDNGDAVTALDDAFYIQWTSGTLATATVAASGDLTAVVKAVKATSGTSTITAQLKKRLPEGDENIGDADTCALTLTIA